MSLYNTLSDSLLLVLFTYLQQHADSQSRFYCNGTIVFYEMKVLVSVYSV